MGSHILVVDDEPAIRFALRGFLEGHGHEVTEAEDGVEGLRMIHLRKPDLVILDVMMTPLSGWQVLHLLHEDPETRRVRVLMFTALGEMEDTAMGWHLGCDWYQVKEKPLNFDDLGLIIERLLAIDPEEEAQSEEPGLRRGEAQ